MVDGPLSVRWFGAKGAKTNDSTDPNDTVTTAAIQAALSAAGPNNAVYVPPGFYVVSNLTIAPEQVLFGAGRDQSVLKGKPGSAGKMLFGFDGHKGNGVKVTIRDLCFDANCVNELYAHHRSRYCRSSLWDGVLPSQFVAA